MSAPRRAMADLRKTAGFTQETLADKLGVDRSTVARWETGETTPQPAQRRRLGRVLGVSRERLAALLAVADPEPSGYHRTALMHSDPSVVLSRLVERDAGRPEDVEAQATVEFGFARVATAVTVESGARDGDGGDAVDRKAFLRVLAGSAAGLAFTDPVSDFLAGAVRSARSRVGQAEVAEVRRMARSLAGQDHGLVGDLVASTVVAQLGVAAQLLDGQFAKEAVRRQLFVAIAELADVVGGICFDAGTHRQAERCFRFAVGCATEGDDWAVRAKALSGLANLAVHTGRRDDALSMAEMALVRADRLPPRTRAVMHTRHARALGLNGEQRETDCLTAIDRAENHFAAAADDEPVWMRYYSAAHLQRDAGRALLYLAVNGGDHVRAQSHLETALTYFPAGPSRGKTLTIANLAHLTMVRDDPSRAVTLGHQALDAVASVQSDRVFESLRSLRAAGRRYATIPAVRELNERAKKAIPV